MDRRLEEELQQIRADGDAALAVEEERHALRKISHAKVMAGMKLPQADYERLVVSIYGMATKIGLNG